MPSSMFKKNFLIKKIQNLDICMKIEIFREMISHMGMLLLEIFCLMNGIWLREILSLLKIIL